jgi:hypothetical protein
MTGNSKYADRMGKLLNEQIEAACPITRAGGTAGQIGTNVGGAVGAAISTGSGKQTSDVAIPQYAWLGVGPQRFTITKASMMGKPTGDPLAQAAYSDVTQALVTEGKLTLRVDLDLRDGSHLVFETKRLGANKPSVEVIELLRSRCPSSS